MKLGLEIAEYAWKGGTVGMADTLAGFARTADDAGFALLAVGDHVWQGPHSGGPEQPILECFTTLAHLAAHSRRCLLAPVVAGVHFRQPGLLAKSVTTLDVLSGGRAMLGLGVGWYEDEAHGLGFSYPSLADRFGMLEETVRICLSMWEGESGSGRSFEGDHYRLERMLNLPQSLSHPHPPIMIGGGGERKTLRLVARYADACNLYPGPDLSAKLDILRRHCDEAGRDYDAIEKTCILPFEVDSDGNGITELVDVLRGLAGQGVHTAIGIVTGDPIAQAEIVGSKILPAVADA